VPKLHIVIDTREKLPYTFDRPPKGYNVITVRKKLDVGDYALLGYEVRACVERKSKADLFNTVGRRCEQFSKRLISMTTMACACVVVESPRESILKGPDYYVMKKQKPGKPKPLTKWQYGARVYNTTIGWAVKPGIPFYFFKDRRQAENWVLGFLIKLRGLLR